MRKKDFKSNKFVIDSFGWIEYFGDGRLSSKYAKHIEDCSPGSYFTPSIIIYEVFKKIRSQYEDDDAISAIMHIQNYTTIIDIDTSLAIKGAETSIQEGLPMADALIRASANKLNAKIITSDPHFKDLYNVVFIE
jgi:predicted nucleic acid-binding protein